MAIAPSTRSPPTPVIPRLLPLHRLTGRLPLRTVLIIPFVVQILAVEAIVGYLSFRTGQRAVADITRQLRNEVTQHTLQRLESYLTLPQVINQVNADAIRLGHVDTDSFEALQTYFWHQSRQFTGVSYIYLGAPDGDIVGVERKPTGELVVGISDETTQGQLYEYPTNEAGRIVGPPAISPKVDVRDRPWYQAAIAAAAPTWSPVYPWVGSHNQLSIDAAQRAYDPGGEFRGVLGVSLTLLDISRFLETLEIGKTGEVYILDREGYLIATSAQDPLFQNHAEGQNPQRIAAQDSQTALIRQSTQYLHDRFGSWQQVRSSAQYDVVIDGDRQFLQITPLTTVPGVDWLVVVVVPEADFMGHIYRNVRSTVVLSLLATGGIVGVGVILARWLSRPVQQLSEASRQLAQGRLEALVPLGGSQELGTLTRSFNHMAETLQHTFQVLETTNAALEQTNADLIQSNAQLEERVQQRTAELQQSEEKFATAFWKAPVPMAISTVDTGEFVEVNTSFANSLGYGVGELRASSSLAVGLWVNLDDRHQIIERLRTQGTLRQEQVALVTKAGKQLLAEFSAEMIELQGQPRVLWMGQDVTERRKLEASRDYNRRCDRLLLEVSRQLLDQTQSLKRVLPQLLSQLGQLTYSDRCFLAVVDPPSLTPATLQLPHLSATPPTLSAVMATTQGPANLPLPERSLQVAMALTPATIATSPLLSPSPEPKSFVIREEWATPNFIQPISDLLPGLSAELKTWLWQSCQDQTPKEWLWEELGPEQESERKLLKTLQLRSFTLVPLVYMDHLVGFLGASRNQGRQGWRGKDIQMLQLMGDVLAMTEAREVAEEALRREQLQSDRLLLNILPQPIATQLKREQRAIAESYAEVTLLFADIVGFTSFSSSVSPEDLVHWLNQVFSDFDTLAESFGLEKIKTVGDEYMVAAGLPLYRPDHAEVIAEMALAMAEAMTYHPTPQGDRLKLRMGINTGAAVAGVIGIRKFIYDLWGDTVNVASRMESSGKPGRIQVSEATYHYLKEKYRFQRRGRVRVKGKGWMMTYWLTGRR
ncbi:MAG: adenylate/guanylate cyclase domain-containing protein [Prochlorothrix sp.]